MNATKTRSATRRVLIVEDDSFIGMGLRADLERLGHAVMGLASSAPEATDLFRRYKPDLLLMDIRLDGTDGIDLTRQLMAERRCPVIIISAYSDPGLVARAAEAGVFGYLVKPVTPDMLKVQIEIAVSRFDDAEKLRQDLETRKLVERAKGILMKRLKLDENTAHRRLQLESQKRRISIADCARRIIDSEKLLSG